MIDLKECSDDELLAIYAATSAWACEEYYDSIVLDVTEETRRVSEELGNAVEAELQQRGAFSDWDRRVAESRLKAGLDKPGDRA